MKLQKLRGMGFVVLAALALSTGHVQAQVTGPADSGRVKEQIDRKLDTTKRRAEPRIQVKERDVKSAPAGAEKLKFTLSRFVIDGMTAYKEGEVESLYNELVGQKISLADVYDIAEKLTVKYRNDGYILTQVIVPAQTIEGGVARLRVVEGFVDGVTIQGEPRGGVEKIRAYAVKIRKSNPLNARALERYLLLINDLPGISARSVLSPSPTVVGAADLQIIVTEDDRYEGVVQADNRGSRFLGPLQLLFANRVNSLFKQHESIGFQAVLAPEGHPDHELEYYSASYAQTVNDEGGLMELEASLSMTEPGQNLSIFDVTGRSEVLTGRYTHPVIRSRSTNLDVHAQYDVIDVTRTDNIPTPVNDRLRVIRAGADYEFSDNLLGINTIGAEVSKGLNFFGNSSNNGPNKSRARGVSDFTKVTAELTRLQYVARNLELFAAVKGQKSAHNLLSTEEFGIGGVAYGSAYDPSEIVGNEGVAAKLELRLTNPVPVDVLSGYQLFAYVDAGRVWDDDATAANLREETISSAGLGARVSITDTLFGSAEVAWPLNHNVQTEGNSDPRFFFTLSKDL